MSQIDEFEIAGQTCNLRIDEYEPAIAGFFSGPQDNWEPDQPPIIGYTVMNPRTNKPWPWLEARMTDKDRAAAEKAIETYMEIATC